MSAQIFDKNQTKLDETMRQAEEVLARALLPDSYSVGHTHGTEGNLRTQATTCACHKCRMEFEHAVAKEAGLGKKAAEEYIKNTYSSNPGRRK